MKRRTWGIVFAVAAVGAVAQLLIGLASTAPAVVAHPAASGFRTAAWAPSSRPLVRSYDFALPDGAALRCKCTTTFASGTTRFENGVTALHLSIQMVGGKPFPANVVDSSTVSRFLRSRTGSGRNSQISLSFMDATGFMTWTDSAPLWKFKPLIHGQQGVTEYVCDMSTDEINADIFQNTAKIISSINW